MECSYLKAYYPKNVSFIEKTLDIRFFALKFVALHLQCYLASRLQLLGYDFNVAFAIQYRPHKTVFSFDT